MEMIDKGGEPRRTWLVMRLAMWSGVRSHRQCDERRDITKV